MDRRLIKSAKGMTLVELLLALLLASLVAVLLIGILISGMNSYRSVNKQITLHDEANAIMTQFSNEIFVATSVTVKSNRWITITKYGGTDDIDLGFEKIPGDPDYYRAIINDTPVHSTAVMVAKSSRIYVKDQTVRIKLVVLDEHEKTFHLDEEISFVKVE